MLTNLWMMQNAIDFRELRRRERQLLRAAAATTSSSKSKSNDNTNTNVKSDDGCGCWFSDSPDVADATNDDADTHKELDIFPSDCAATADGASQSQDVSFSLEPYQTLLPHHKITEDMHRMRSSHHQTSIDSVYYAQNFLSPTQGKEIMAWLESIPEYSQQYAQAQNKTGGTRLTEREESIQHNGKWTRLKHAKRRVALFDGTICPLPYILQRLVLTLCAVDAFSSSKPPNHVLVNEYQPGEGILPHTDGPVYESRTATISLGGSDVIFKLWPRRNNERKNDQPSLEVILSGYGSLVLFSNDAYLNHCHEISEGVLEESTSLNGVCANDINGGTIVKRGYRVSLTFRHKK